jgi:hypothetical protein
MIYCKNSGSSKKITVVVHILQPAKLNHLYFAVKLIKNNNNKKILDTDHLKKKSIINKNENMFSMNLNHDPKY